MTMQKKQKTLLSSSLQGLATLPLAAAAGWIAYSNLAIDHQVYLPDAVPASRREFTDAIAGRMSYYAATDTPGRPLVLIHSINAAASAYEMRPLFQHYRGLRPVYALELPGFGFSDRSARPYSSEMYTAAVRTFLQTQVGEPADVVTLSLSSEFCAKAALQVPELFNSLTLISPTGFRLRQNDRGSQKASSGGFSDRLHSAFAVPIWARPLYDLLATQTSIEFYLRKSFLGPIPPDLVAYSLATSHQPGAEHAPLYFISGKLFTSNILQSVYRQVQVPTLVIYDRDSYTSFDLLPDLLTVNSAWQAVRIVPTLGLPHFERLDETVEVLNQFWK